MTVPRSHAVRARGGAGLADAAVLAACWAAARLPFLGSFDLVSHDGTYYITQARQLLSGTFAGGGAFPPGYPALIATFMTVVGDDVRAAQAASAAASLVATIALYALARGFLPRPPSLLCAVLFTATPVFVRSSLTTMSESAYVAWVLLALFAFARGRRSLAGLALGAAALTRPEALGVAAVAFVAFAWGDRRHGPRRALRLFAASAAPFLAVYSLYAMATAAAGDVSLVPKWHFLGAGARDWSSFDEDAEGDVARAVGAGSVVARYAARLPGDAAQLFVHTMGVAFLAAIVGAVRRPTVVLAALAPFFAIPLFTFRHESRFVVPFVPVCMLYAFVGAHALASTAARRLAVALLVAAAAAGFHLNRGELTRPESDGFEAAREAGIALREAGATDATVADRKPFVAFYARARYVEIPRGPYEQTISDLVRRADYLTLMVGVTDFFRPELAPLLYADAAILGELRFSQFYANDGGVVVYARADDAPGRSGLDVSVVSTLPAGSLDATFSRSPDGRRVALCDRARAGALLVHDAATPGAFDTLVVHAARVSQPRWSPDGSRIAFVSAESGNPDVFVLNVAAGAVTRVTRSPARDVDPSWDGSGAVVFASDRAGRFDLWRETLPPRGEPEQLTFGGGKRRPCVSPDGDRIAFVSETGRVVIRDRRGGVEVVARSPARATSAPSWSPDGLFLVVAASDAGGGDVYLLRSDGSRALRLTAYEGDEEAPEWRPGPSGEVAVTMTRGSRRVVARLDGIAPYRERLDHPPSLRVFDRPASR